MFRLLHPVSHHNHRVNPIVHDFDSNVQLVRLKLSQQQQQQPAPEPLSLQAEFSPPEFQRRASGGSASISVSNSDVDMLMVADILASPSPKFLARRQKQQQQQQRRSSDSPGATPSQTGLFSDRLVSTPLTGSGCADFGALHRSSAARPDAASACLDELRLSRPRRFYEICRVHLAFVTDVPADFLQDLIDEACPQTQSINATVAAVTRRTPSTAGGLLERVCRTVRQQHHSGSGHLHSAEAPTSDAAAPAVRDDDGSLSAEFVAGIGRLIRLLESRLDAEGIFRKSGQITRQRQLRRRLFPTPDELAAAPDLASEAVAEAAVSELRCCVHDVAGVLKACLADLRQPLLTDRLGPYFLQVADLNPHRLDENSNPTSPSGDKAARLSLAATRQLRGYRILVQLLPRSNRNMLRSLLRLLGQVASLPRTLMTPENLGTVFGPLLLCPRQMKSTDDYARIIALSNEAVAYMIRHADELFKVPEHLAIDALRSLSADRSRCCSRSREADDAIKQTDAADGKFQFIADNKEAENDDDDDEEAVDVCVNFVDRATAQRLGGRDYTQLQVAELYAAVQAMPESSKKSALVRKFSAAANATSAAAAAVTSMNHEAASIESLDGRRSRRRLCGH